MAQRNEIKDIVKTRAPIRTGRFARKGDTMPSPPSEPVTEEPVIVRARRHSIVSDSPRVADAIPESEKLSKPGETKEQAIKRHRRSELEKLTSFQSPLEEAQYIIERLAALDFKKARLLEMCSDAAFDVVKRYI